MAVGYEDRGVDLDDRFELRVSGDPQAANVGFEYWNGSVWVDLSARYLPIANGSALGFNVGYENINGVDLSQIFAGKGTGYQVSSPWAGESYFTAWDQGSTGQAIATLTFSINSNGAYTVSSSGQQLELGSDTSPQGDWLLNGTASDFQVRMTPTITSGAPSNQINGASTWVNAGTTRSYQVSDSSNFGTEETQGTLLIEIRRTSTSEVVASGTLNFTVTANGGS